MMTAQTCPTSALEKLIAQFRDPKSFTESIILRGAQAEFDHRERERKGTNSEVHELEAEIEEANRELKQAETDLEQAHEKINALELRIEDLEKTPPPDAITQMVEAALPVY